MKKKKKKERLQHMFQKFMCEAKIPWYMYITINTLRLNVTSELISNEIENKKDKKFV